MRVEGYQVSLASSWQEKKSLVVEERLEIRTGGNVQVQPGDPWPVADRVELSLDALDGQNRGICGHEEVDDSDLPPELREKVRIVALLVELFTGRKLKVEKIEVGKPGENQGDMPAGPAAVNAGTGRGWGLSYDYRSCYSEEEKMSFSGRGLVKTADGQVLKFEFDLALSRSFVREERVSLRVGQAAVDPLVITFGDGGPSFTADPWLFDLDGDGVAEKLASLAPGSGFLVLDRNGDGVINDGREMFGPATGDGWAELAAHDSDGNGWIDEADPVFSQLRVFVRDGGSEILFTLPELSVGAIFWGRVSAPFSFRSASNSDLALLRSGGIYLRENGRPGFIGRVDLVDIEA